MQFIVILDGVFFFRMMEYTTEDKPAQEAILFSISTSFHQLKEGIDERTKKKDWVDMMLVIIKKSFSCGQESRDLQRSLCHALLHDVTADFLTKVSSVHMSLTTLLLGHLPLAYLDPHWFKPIYHLEYIRGFKLPGVTGQINIGIIVSSHLLEIPNYA